MGGFTTGVVTADPAAGMVSVLLTGQSVPAAVAICRGVSVNVGDTVLVGVDAAPYVIGALGLVASTPVIGGVGAPASPTGSVETLTPIGSATWRAGTGGWRTDTSQLYSGDWTGKGINWGGAWYGTGFRGRGTFAAGVAKLTRRAGGSGSAVTPTMLLLAESSRPAAWVVPIATTAGPSLAIDVTTDWTIPDAWRALLQSGAAGGIGIGQAGTIPYLAMDPPPIVSTFTT